MTDRQYFYIRSTLTMITPNDEKLKDIAAELASGNICYYEISTGEVLSAPNMDPDEFEAITGEKSDAPAIMKLVEASPDNYIEIEPPESYQSFGFMEDFIETISDGRTQNYFALSIRKKSPFQQFRNCLLNYPDIRQKWFVYKDQRMVAYVKDLIERHPTE